MGSVLAGFSAADQRRIRNAVADRGPEIFASPLVGGSRSDVARYLAEGEGPDSLIRRLDGRHDWRLLWKAIAEVIAEDPAVVERSPAHARADAQARTAWVDGIVAEAERALAAGDMEGVAGLLDQALAIDPDHRLPGPGGSRSLGVPLSSIRDAVAAKRPERKG